MANMLIHDTRLQGGTPSGLATNNYSVVASTSIYHIFEWADYYARSQKGLENLFIFCHGNSAFLQLGDKNIDINSTNLFSIFSGDVKNIVLASCLVASGTNGPIFCSKIAQQSNATVVASNTTQEYSFWAWSKFGLNDSSIDMGPWEGEVYKYYPNGSWTHITSSPPPISN